MASATQQAEEVGNQIANQRAQEEFTEVDEYNQFSPAMTDGQKANQPSSGKYRGEVEQDEMQNYGDESHHFSQEEESF